MATGFSQMAIANSLYAKSTNRSNASYFNCGEDKKICAKAAQKRGAVLILSIEYRSLLAPLDYLAATTHQIVLVVIRVAVADLSFLVVEHS